MMRKHFSDLWLARRTSGDLRRDLTYAEKRVNMSASATEAAQYREMALELETELRIRRERMS